MAELSKIYPLTFIVGPTAVGKSEFALQAAQKFSGAIVNFDSLQFFTDLNIGTAKPSKEERQLYPHFLFDICNKGESFTAGEFRREALKVIAENEKNFPLFFVGGSGFYLQALEKGMYEVEDVPADIAEQTQKELEEHGLSFLYQELKCKDPEYSVKIAANDTYRIIRAINLMRTLNKPMTQIMNEFRQQQEEKKLDKVIVKIGLTMERAELRKRIEIRTDKMLQMGLIEEVQGLLSSIATDWSPLSCVGYKEVIAHLKGEGSIEEMREKIITHTMQLAKRQMTWFKRDPEIQWFDPQEGLEKALDYLRLTL